MFDNLDSSELDVLLAPVVEPSVLPDDFNIEYHPDQPWVNLTRHQVIHDPEFNYIRTTAAGSYYTTDEDSNAASSLSGIMGDGAPTREAFYNPLVRFATPKERKRWLELHKHESWFSNIPDEDKLKFVPFYIIIDGFGRFEEELSNAENPDTHQISFKVINTSDEYIGRWIGLIANTSQRPLSPIDYYENLKLLKDRFGWNQTQLAHRTKNSKSRITQLFKCGYLSGEERAKAIKEKWSLNKIKDYVDKTYLTAPEEKKTTSEKPSSMKGASRKYIKQNIQEFLAQKSDQLSVYDKGFLDGFLAALTYQDSGIVYTDVDEEKPVKEVEEVFDSFSVDLEGAPILTDKPTAAGATGKKLINIPQK